MQSRAKLICDLHTQFIRSRNELAILVWVTSNFSFSRSVFKRLVLQTRKIQGLFGKGLTTQKMWPFENLMGTGENAGNQQFVLFPQCFLTFPKQAGVFEPHLFCCLQMLSIWSSLKFCCLITS